MRPCAPAGVRGSPASATRDQGALHLCILAVVEVAHNRNTAPPWIHLHVAQISLDRASDPSHLLAREGVVMDVPVLQRVARVGPVRDRG
eukprot:2232323-Pyramimonas_sp.AAC.1